MIVAIANPAAGGGAGARLAHRLREVFDDVELVTTGGPGDATRLARKAVEDRARAVVSIGGDGTHGEVASGLVGASVPLAIVHAGTGGDFRRMILGGGSIEALRTATVRTIDVGTIDYVADDGTRATRTFLNLASAGLSGVVDRLVAGTRRLRKLAYVTASLRAIAATPAQRMRITVDGVAWDDRPLSVLTVCNGRYAGGGMCFAPDARLSDGWLDVVAIPETSLMRSIVDAPALYRGTHLAKHGVRWTRGRTIAVEGDALVDIDGEAPGRLPATFRVVPAALQVLAVDPRVT